MFIEQASVLKFSRLEVALVQALCHSQQPITAIKQVRYAEPANLLSLHHAKYVVDRMCEQTTTDPLAFIITADGAISVL